MNERSTGRREEDVRAHVKSEMFSLRNMVLLATVITTISAAITGLFTWMGGETPLGPGAVFKREISTVRESVAVIREGVIRVDDRVDSLVEVQRGSDSRVDTVLLILDGLTWFTCNDSEVSVRELRLSKLPCGRTRR